MIKKRSPLYYLILPFLTARFVLCPPAFADSVKGLQEIYETPIPAQIRKNFDGLVEIRKICPECELGVLDGEKFVDIYPKKFIVLSLEPNSFGGFWVSIAVEGERKNTFRLWLYEVQDKEYDLRSIEELPGALEEALVRQIQSLAYRHYWL